MVPARNKLWKEGKEGRTERGRERERVQLAAEAPAASIMSSRPLGGSEPSASGASPLTDFVDPDGLEAEAAAFDLSVAGLT